MVAAGRWFMRVLTYVGALVVATSAAGCSVATTSPPGPPRTAVIVQNESTFDVEVYLWDGWNRATRLGFVSAGDTADLDVPEAVIAAMGPYSLEARPTVSAEYPTNSERFALRAGYRITWAIPPADALGAAREEIPSDTVSRPPGHDQPTPSPRRP
jgi:hypothetical protein